MREPIISNLDGITKEIIDALEDWLKRVKSGHCRAGMTCPFNHMDVDSTDERCSLGCMLLFDNKELKGKAYCPCYDCNFGEEATILAFQIICDVWKGYH